MTPIPCRKNRNSQALNHQKLGRRELGRARRDLGPDLNFSAPVHFLAGRVLTVGVVSVKPPALIRATSAGRAAVVVL